MRASVPLRIDIAGGWTDVADYADEYGGRVVNIAINQRVTGERDDVMGCGISYKCGVPTGSGLGTSGAMNVLWANLVTSITDPAVLAEAAYGVECALGIKGGKQDQYAAAFGGINQFFFTKDVVNARPCACADVQELEDRLVLCYTGDSRSSSRIHRAVWDRFAQKDPAYIHILHRLADYAVVAPHALENGNIDELARIIGANWNAQKMLHEDVTNDTIEGLFAAAKDAGVLSGKAVGAGGGGCLLFVTKAGAKKDVSRALFNAGALIIDFAIDFDGLRKED
jgi:D-glycero-alpha-D-manno-heptose-7-phosphate kinase